MKNKIYNTVQNFVLLYFSIVLSVLLRFTDSDYPFGIFKLFLPTILWQFERCCIFCFSFYNCSNGVVYFVFHLMTVQAVSRSTKVQKSTKHTLTTNDRVTRTSLKTGGELRYSRRVTDTRGEIDTLLYDW
jgi:hypothetical protein